MKIIDTHSHIYQPDFDIDIDEVICRAEEVGVKQILLPNIDLQSIPLLHKLVKRYPDYCIPMMGLHPTSVTANWMYDLAVIKKQFEKHSYIAIGEIGIDLYWDKTYEKEQKSAFEEQLRWSIEYNLPVAIHTRDATEEAIECIEKIGASDLRGVFHSFGGTIDQLNKILSLGNFLLGINGVVTFKNSNLSSVLSHTDLSHIIVETDAPYLSPVPFRGKRNEPSYTMNIVNKLSEIYGLTPAEVGDITSRNAEILFNLNN